MDSLEQLAEEGLRICLNKIKDLEQYSATTALVPDSGALWAQAAERLTNVLAQVRYWPEEPPVA